MFIYGGIIGAIIGFVIGMLYQNDLTPGVLQRLVISTGLAALLPALPLIALRDGDWLGTGLIILTLMIVSGIMPAITTTRRKSRNIGKELS
jgi:hypothetical protein